MTFFKGLSLGVGCFLSAGFFVSQSFANPIKTFETLYENSQGVPVLSTIKSAKNTIDIEIYTMKDLLVLKALKSAMKRGVKLRIIQTENPVDACKVFDPIKETDDPICVELKNFVPFVRKNGGSYVPFGNHMCATPGANCFEHGKILIADSKKVLLSTGNYDPSNFCNLNQSPRYCNRDFTVVSTDPVVIKALSGFFEKDFLGVAYDVKAMVDSPEAARITVSPYSLEPLVSFIRSANKSLQIEAQYLKNEELRNAIKETARRGVKVFVVVASACAFGKLDPARDSSAINQWTQTYTEFDQAGIHTRVFNGSNLINGEPGYMHAKAILVDGKRAWIGSANGSTTSLTQNREYGLFTESPQVIKLLGSVMYSDFMDKNTETWQESLVCKKDPQPVARPSIKTQDK